MKSRVIFFLLILSATLQLQAQPYYYVVIAEQGLSMREQPSLDAPKLMTIPFMDEVARVSGATDSLQVKDGDRIIKGQWIKVRHLASRKDGYVFDGYLLPTVWSDYESWCKKQGAPCNARLYGKGFSAIIYDYQTNGNDFGAKNDTIQTDEDIGVALENKILQFIPERASDSIFVAMSYLETIWPDMEGVDMWRGNRPFKRLYGKHNFYQFPDKNYAMLEGWRKGNMGLGDTLVEYSGEGGYRAATLLYKGVPAFYEISAAILKVVVYRKGEAPRTTYAYINFTYGC